MVGSSLTPNGLYPGKDPAMKPEDLIGKVPWITSKGFLDPGKFPIDGVLKQALSTDEAEFRSALAVLRSMYGHERKEAGIFLLGLFMSCEDNWGKRSAIVEALQGVNTQACADVLFREFKRFKSSNTTRRYLGTVLNVLAQMPSELIEEGFEELANDKSFSQKMRAKFRAVLNRDSYGFEDYF